MATPKLREIERLRGLAILMVFANHSPPLTALLPGHIESWSGVDLFFVISGFVVTLSLGRLLPPLPEPTAIDRFIAAGTSLRVFFARRFYRLAPMIVFLLLLQLCLSAGTGWWATFGHPEDLLRVGIAVFSGTFNYVLAAMPLRDAALWSLSVEEHFYLLLPVLFVVASSTSRRFMVCAAVLVLVAFVIRPLTSMDGNWDHDRIQSHVRFDSLMAGVLLALLGTERRSRGLEMPKLIIPRWFVRAVVVPVCVLLLCYTADVGPNVGARIIIEKAGLTAFWFLSAILVACAARDEGLVLQVPLLGRVLEYVGSRSYALYLLHRPVLEAFTVLKTQDLENRFFGDSAGHRLFEGAATLAVGLLLSEVAYRFVEQPFIALGRRATTPDEGDAALLASARWKKRLAFGLRVAPAAVLLALIASCGINPVGPHFRRWRAEYFGNADLRGAPVRTRESVLRFDWEDEAPHAGLPRDNFSARFTTCLVTTEPHNLRFVIAADDGVRVLIDGKPVLDRRTTPPKELPAATTLAPGAHPLVVEYFEDTGKARLTLLVSVDGGAATDLPDSWLRTPTGGQCAM